MYMYNMRIKENLRIVHGYAAVSILFRGLASVYYHTVGYHTVEAHLESLMKVNAYERRLLLPSKTYW
jgi:hypothetical protein